ncbi:MAG: hypothetical protein ACFB2W_25035 [Leptolyngbyaceae cyanobacterium]
MNSEKMKAETNFSLVRNPSDLAGLGDLIFSSKSEHTKLFSELNSEETHAISGGGGTPTGYPFTYSSSNSE